MPNDIGNIIDQGVIIENTGNPSVHMQHEGYIFSLKKCYPSDLTLQITKN
jgi:hypothetical protein